MTTNYHTAITAGASNAPSTINTRFATLDAQITSLAAAGGNVFTQANGAASAAQKVVTVDSTTGIVAGARVVYALAGGALEYNTVATKDSATQITLSTNIGTGGIADNAVISAVNEDQYTALSKVNAGNGVDATLGVAMEAALGRVVSVAAYGAAGDGSANDRDAIQAAFDAAAALVDAESTPSQGTIPLIRFEPGRTYSVGSALTVPDYAIIQGNNAIIKASANTFNVLDVDNAQDCTIRDLQFRDGQVAIAYDPVTPNWKLLRIENCSFANQTAAAIKQKATTINGLQIIITGCKFRNTNTGALLVSAYADLTSIRDCWMQAKCDTWIINGGVLAIDGLLTVPDLVTGMTLIDNQDPGSVFLTNSRLGSESGGMQIFENNAIVNTTTSGGRPAIIIRNNKVGSGTNAGRIGTFNALPNVFIFEGNGDLANNLGFEFDSGIAAADIASMGNYSTHFSINGNAQDVRVLAGTQTTALRALLADKAMVKRTGRDLVAASVALNLTYADMTSAGTTLNTTVVAQANTFGTSKVQITAAADGAYRNYRHLTALNGLSAGVYTLVAEVEVPGATTLMCQVSAATDSSDATAGFGRQLQLTTGNHLVHLPFYYNGSDEMITVGFYEMPNAAVGKIGSVRVFFGVVEIDTINTIIYGNAAPGSGTWRVGDIVWDLSPTASGAIGSVCVTAGAPGTWKTFGAIEA